MSVTTAHFVKTVHLHRADSYLLDPRFERPFTTLFDRRNETKIQELDSVITDPSLLAGQFLKTTRQSLGDDADVYADDELVSHIDQFQFFERDVVVIGGEIFRTEPKNHSPLFLRGRLGPQGMFTHADGMRMNAAGLETYERAFVGDDLLACPHDRIRELLASNSSLNIQMPFPPKAA